MRMFHELKLARDLLRTGMALGLQGEHVCNGMVGMARL